MIKAEYDHSGSDTKESIVSFLFNRTLHGLVANTWESEVAKTNEENYCLINL